MDKVKKLIIPISGIYDEKNTLCDTLDLIPGYIQSIKDNNPNIFYEEAINVIIEEWNSPIDVDDENSVAEYLDINSLDIDRVIATLDNSMEYLKGQIDEAIEGDIASKIINQNEILSCNKVSEDLMVLKLEDKISPLIEQVENGSYSRSEPTSLGGNLGIDDKRKFKEYMFADEIQQVNRLKRFLENYEDLSYKYLKRDAEIINSLKLKSPYPSKEFIEEHNKLIEWAVNYQNTLEFDKLDVDPNYDPFAFFKESIKLPNL